MTTTKQLIDQLRFEYLAAPFPGQYSGEEIEKIDLIMLDADTAGCIQTFIDQDGKLDQWRTAILGLCYHDLSVVLPHLDDEGRQYYSRLETAARLVLEAVVTSSKPDGS